MIQRKSGKRRVREREKEKEKGGMALEGENGKGKRWIEGDAKRNCKIKGGETMRKSGKYGKGRGRRRTRVARDQAEVGVK